ncbi:MAG: permease [Lachnospiraceae bacterium]
MKKNIPVYMVTGFLGGGKSTFINERLLAMQKKQTSAAPLHHLIIQFEEGEIEISSAPGSKNVIWSIRQLEEEPDKIAAALVSLICAQPYDSIWVECNGMADFSVAEALFLQPQLSGRCYIRKVIHISEITEARYLLGQTGFAPLTQLTNSDIALYQDTPDRAAVKSFKRLLRTVNRSLSVLSVKSEDVTDYVHTSKRNEVGFFLAVVFLFVIYILLSPSLEALGFPLNTILNVFLGLFLQGFPFLLIGVLLSSLITVFLPDEKVQKFFPKNPVAGIAVALVMGFFVPVCDCASIPLFKSLLKKGVPLASAVTFLMATPLINPVVLLSTYYAFNSSLTIMGLRAGLGLLSALLIGITFLLVPSRSFLKEQQTGYSACSCGCYEDNIDTSDRKGRGQLFLRHAQLELFSVGKYLMAGTLLSAILQTLNLDLIKTLGGSAMPISLAAMMALSFILSLCSSSDAVVARSLSGFFPFSSLMGFLVFGPMMDIKNVMMLASGFNKKFIVRLLITSFVISFLVVGIFALTGAGGISL